MKFQQLYLYILGILCFSILCFAQLVENENSSDQALLECGTVHQIDIKQHPSASGSYYNSGCTLLCVIVNDTMTAEPINEGKSCPEDTSGICHKGECIGGVDDALNQCGQRHRLNFRKINDNDYNYDHTGTAFTNDHCLLKCVISGKEWSANQLHEGSSCPSNSSGVCRAGACVDKSTSAPTPTTSLPPTIRTIEPTTAPSDRALKECANVHHIDIDKFPSSSARYDNAQCMLQCVIGRDTLPWESINEYKPCPADTTGTCLEGVCIGQESAEILCANIHGDGKYKGDVDDRYIDKTGTTFSNGHCTLICEAILRDHMSPLHTLVYNTHHNIHEGSPCPTNSDGICRKGVCVAQSTILGSTIPVLPTKTVTQPWFVKFYPSKMKLLNISLESAVPSLRQKASITIDFYPSNEKYVSYNKICTFYGNPTQPNDYVDRTLHYIPSNMEPTSHMNFLLIDKNDSKRNGHLDDVKLYSLFYHFYENRKLAFGQQEHFVSTFPISRTESPFGTIMNVTLRFTIVYNE